MYQLCQKLAANLRKKFKIDNGDVIGIMSPNSPEYPIITYGTLTAGGVVTTLNPIYTACNLFYIFCVQIGLGQMFFSKLSWFWVCIHMKLRTSIAYMVTLRVYGQQWTSIG